MNSFRSLFGLTRPGPGGAVATSAVSAAVAGDAGSWTGDGKSPYICWGLNAHGSMNRNKTRTHEYKETSMDVGGYSIAGNENQCGLMGVVTIPSYEKYHEFNGKGIDYCIPSLLRSIFYTYKNAQGGMDQEACFDKASTEVTRLYHAAGQYRELYEKGGFQTMTEPTRYHFYQLHANPGENARFPTGRPKRSAAGDVRFSQSELYGVWIIYTNIEALQHLSLTSITDEELKMRGENKGHSATHLFLPPDILNRVNMAGRKNRRPIGAALWMTSIKKLAKYDNLTPAGEIKRLRIRAMIALNNLWKTRDTNLHDILDIFAPFNLIGIELGEAPIKVRTIDVTCRSPATLTPPDPEAPLFPTTKIVDSANSYSEHIEHMLHSGTTTKRPAFAESEHDEEEVFRKANIVAPDDEYYPDDDDDGAEGAEGAEGADDDDEMSENGDGDGDGDNADDDRMPDDDGDDDGDGDGDDDDEWEEEEEEEQEEDMHPSPPAVGADTNRVRRKMNSPTKKNNRYRGVKKGPPKTLQLARPGASLKHKSGPTQGVGKVVSSKPKHKPRDPLTLLSLNKRGGAKRKYSRKRNTRTRNRYTRRRTRRYTRRRRTPR